MKILILKPSSLGDVVQAIPVLRMLKRHWPEAQTWWWIEKASAPLLERDPDLAGIIPWDRRRWGSPLHYGDIWRCVREIRRHRFDLVIDLQALARSGTIAWLANGAFTVGLQDWRELALGYYDASVKRRSAETHAVDWYLDVLKLLGVPIRWDFEWLPVNNAAASEVASLLDGRSAPIVLQPGARWENKRWPAEHFAETVRLLHERDDRQRFVIVGGADDHDLAARIVSEAPTACSDLTGRTTLPQLVEVIRAGKLMITNDTGPMHIAAALGKPVIGLFGPTNPLRTGPYGQQRSALQRHDLPCIPCLDDRCHWHEAMACLRGIAPTRVAEQVLRVLRADEGVRAPWSIPDPLHETGDSVGGNL